MSNRVRTIMISFAGILMICIFIVLSLQKYMHDKAQVAAEDFAVPALSPIKARGEARYARWMGDIADPGKVIYLNFWASWCEPCKEELPYLEQLQAELGPKGFKVVLLNLDFGADVEVAKKMKLGLAPNLVSNYENASSSKKRLQLPGLPYHTLVDKNGRVALVFFGTLMPYKEAFKRRVLELLAE